MIFYSYIDSCRASYLALVVKNSSADAGDLRDRNSIPWSRKWQPTPILLPGKSYGQRSLVGYSPQGHKELDTSGGT